ncbi:MAG: beta-glucosidase [Halanaerobiales bacterium]|nr:beta-glucosidase [Halanaerobiales bacterium]HKL43455.1 GH1 family beta-glucosidase [Clostridia bacterium]
MEKYKFPQDFRWGTATSSYQIEGAYNQDGKGLSIWDTFTHSEGNIYNNDTGDQACDHYNRYKEDVKLMEKMGINSYRFSISWPRVLPNGRGEVNKKGLKFYKNLVDELLKANIEPVVTFYHWDLPQKLQDEGGWGNRDIVKYFVNYAELIFDELGDKVKTWITINEPFVVAFHGNSRGDHAPGIKNHKVALQVAHNLLVSHGEVVKKFRNKNLDGDIGISLNLTPTYSFTDKKEDVQAAKLLDEYINGWFLDPIFKGKYPDKLSNIYLKKYGKINKKKNDLELINQDIDFLGINYYSRALVKYNPELKFYGIETVKRKENDYTEMDWEIYPDGLYDLLININHNYTDIPIFITENGAAFDDKIINKKINDSKRIKYLYSHFKSAYKALQNGVPLKRYYVWSLMDNFEWAYGYSKRFGLIYIDYKTKKRFLKDSAYWYKKVIKNNSI